MRSIILASLISLMVCGCTTTRHLRSPLDANHKPITDKADIVLRSGEIIEATYIEVGRDTTRYIIQGIGSYRQIPTSSIERLFVNDRFAGSVGGFVGGAVGGLAAGVLAAKIAGVPPSGETAMGNIPFLLGGILLGSTCGTVYGWSHGYQQHYTFPPDTTDTLIYHRD